MKPYNIFIYDNMYLNNFFMLCRYFHNNKFSMKTLHSFSLFVYYNVVLSLCQVLVKGAKISKEVHAPADMPINTLKD